MPALCSRVDCSEPAVAVFGFDATAALVWLDPYEGRAKGAGMLCADHADTITPLRGWTLVDRRARAPRLWAERPRVVVPPRARARRARRSFHPVAADTPEASLPFDERAPRAGAPALERVVREEALEGPAAGSPIARPELDALLDARTPMLARAFQSAQSARPRAVDP